MFNNEIAFNDHEAGLEVAKMLLNEGYVVLLSHEEKLLIVNFEWSPNFADRNDMVFMSRENFEDKYCEICKEE